MGDMTTSQREALARFIISLRPGSQGWGYDDCHAALVAAGTISRDAGLLTHAAIAAALDPSIARPSVIPMPGRHWERAQAAHQADADRRPQPPRVGDVPICDICGKSEDDCRTRAHLSDHDFEPHRLLTTRQPPQKDPNWV